MKQILITIEQTKYDDDRPKITISVVVDGYIKFFEAWIPLNNHQFRFMKLPSKDNNSYKTNE